MTTSIEFDPDKYLIPKDYAASILDLSEKEIDLMGSLGHFLVFGDRVYVASVMDEELRIYFPSVLLALHEKGFSFKEKLKFFVQPQEALDASPVRALKQGRIEEVKLIIDSEEPRNV